MNKKILSLQVLLELTIQLVRKKDLIIKQELRLIVD